MDCAFWKDRRVFVTGHTGFKGSWLCLWLGAMGAKVAGYALPPPTEPSLFDLCAVGRAVDSTIGDVRDGAALLRALRAADPEIVIHLAAQPLVLESHRAPVETYATNVMGTVNLLEAVRAVRGVRAVVNITTDKCYDNREWVWGYREIEPLGGRDPYSSSKACSELVTSAYRSSFFDSPPGGERRAALASARAGNVIGGGDWARNRLVPDCVRAFLSGDRIVLRNPGAVRPWQHVLEALGGYLLLAQRLCEEGGRYAEAWNFGPGEDDIRTVEWVARALCDAWGGGAGYAVEQGEGPREAGTLTLDCSKARDRLGWRPRWTAETAVAKVIEWTRAYRDGKDPREACLRQIDEYARAAARGPAAGSA